MQLFVSIYEYVSRYEYVCMYVCKTKQYIVIALVEFLTQQKDFLVKKVRTEQSERKV